MAGVVGAFAWLACGASYADVLGVDPQMMATRASEERQADAKHRIEEEWERRSLVTSEPSSSDRMMVTTRTVCRSWAARIAGRWA
jgi:hypothetical protein